MAKKLKYRMQIILDQKEEAKKNAAILLTEAREHLVLEQQEEARLNEEYRLNRERKNTEYQNMAQEGLMGGFQASSAQGRLNFIKKLDVLAEEILEKVEHQKKRVKQAEEEVEEALQHLIQASRELQVMEKHKEKWLEDMKKEIAAAEQKEMNEIGNVMYMANRSAS